MLNCEKALSLSNFPRATEGDIKECSTFYLFLRNYSTFTNYEIKICLSC